MFEDRQNETDESNTQSIADAINLIKSGFYKNKRGEFDVEAMPEGKTKDYINSHWDLFKSGAFKSAVKHIPDDDLKKLGIRGKNMMANEALIQDFGDFQNEIIIDDFMKKLIDPKTGATLAVMKSGVAGNDNSNNHVRKATGNSNLGNSQ